jgi:hypothetical protein
MAEFCYTNVPSKIKILFEKIRDVAIPGKATTEWLKTIGFKSSNDRTLIGVLRQIDFIDSSAIPTEKWKNYRGASYKLVLGQAIRDGYATLFSVYPDAEKRTSSEIEHVFSTKLSSGKEVISRAISTFNSLIALAEFPAAVTITDNPTIRQENGKPSLHKEEEYPRVAMSPSLHIDIQVHISPEASLDQIDKIFESMARHLYGGPKA